LREIKKQYVVDEENRTIAVQIDLETFQEMEEVIGLPPVSWTPQKAP
jgi:hypothetical protein